MTKQTERGRGCWSSGGQDCRVIGRKEEEYGGCLNWVGEKIVDEWQMRILGRGRSTARTGRTTG